MKNNGDRKIVLYGPPLAGKTTILRAFQDQYGGKFAVREVTGRNSRQFPDRALFLTSKVREVQVELSTMPGGYWDVTAWEHLFDSSTDLLPVLDGQVTCLEANLQRLVYLSSLQNMKANAVVVTKADLSGQGIEMWEPSTMRGFLENTMLEVFTSRFDQPETLLAPIKWILGHEVPSSASRNE